MEILFEKVYFLLKILGFILKKCQKLGFLPQIGEFFFRKPKIKSKKSFLNRDSFLNHSFLNRDFTVPIHKMVLHIQFETPQAN